MLFSLKKDINAKIIINYPLLIIPVRTDVQPGGNYTNGILTTLALINVLRMLI